MGQSSRSRITGNGSVRRSAGEARPVGNTKSGGDRMRGLTRGAMTLFGVVVAGFLIWFGASALPDEGDASLGEFWWAAGLIAAAGLTMALSQLLGDWTKWGWPRISGNVFLLGFLPALIAGGWIVAAGEPSDHWLGSHVRSWSDDIGLEGLVGDLMKACTPRGV